MSLSLPLLLHLLPLLVLLLLLLSRRLLLLLLLPKSIYTLEKSFSMRKTPS
jgi:hypothetical protein